MQAYQDKKIGGFCHVYIGQEAVAVGTIAATEARDPIVTAYRDHGHALARGMDPKHCMAEMYGHIGGCAKGKGGSMHISNLDVGMLGANGIVGAGAPIMANYVPVLDAPAFAAALLVFGAGVALLVALVVVFSGSRGPGRPRAPRRSSSTGRPACTGTR